MSWFCVGYLLPDMGIALKSGLLPQWDFIRENSSGCQLEAASGLGIAVCIHFPSQCWNPSWCRPMQGLCHLPQSVSSYVHWSSRFQKSVFSQWSPSPLALHFLCLLFWKSPWPRGEGFGGGIPFMTEISKLSLSTHWLWVSAPICYRRKHLWWWLSKAHIYEYSRTSLGVILLLCPFSGTVVFSFPLDLWSI